VREVSIRARDRINASSRGFPGTPTLSNTERNRRPLDGFSPSNGRALFCSFSPFFPPPGGSCALLREPFHRNWIFRGTRVPFLSGKHVRGASCFVSLMYSAVRNFIQLLMRPATISGLCFFFLIRLSSKFPLLGVTVENEEGLNSLPPTMP
jgi:hypothetical protein